MDPEYQVRQQNIYMASLQRHMREEWQGTSVNRRDYKEVMQAWRAEHGLVDGLRTDQAGFAAYMAKRRAEDARRRPGRA